VTETPVSPRRPATSRLGADVLAEVDRLLAGADEELRRYPGDPGTRQPVHTVYVAADAADDDTPRSWGEQAAVLLADHVPDAAAALEVTGLPGVDDAVLSRVRAKLADQPVEDLRLDFEDGYGARADEQEDADAGRAGRLLADLLRAPAGPSFAGIRFKSLEPATRRRGLRTLDLVVDAVLAAGLLPVGFHVTLPKVTSVPQVEAMAAVCSALEREHGLPPGRLRFEIQVETPQAIIGAQGHATVARMIHAAAGRCTSLHYGTYDYSAACGISAAQQSLAHPVADHAKAVMQVAAAGTGVRLSDGSTNLLPVGSADEVRVALRLHAELVRRSLERGYYQGWDMHPGHLVSRYLATYAFYRQGLPAAAVRLSNYLSRTAAGVLDEPATAQALAAFVTRGLQCGALDAAEVAERSGIEPTTLDALARRLPLPTTDRREEAP
jgi:citrate lyase beta subunit